MLTATALGPAVLMLQCLADGPCADPKAIPPSTWIVAPVSEDEPRTLRGDWEPPDTVLLGYNDAWPDALEVILEETTRSAAVWVMIEEGHHVREAKRFLRRLPAHVAANVRVLDMLVDTSWVRDYGPFQARADDGSLIWIDAIYGGGRRMDDAVPTRLATKFGVEVEPLELGIDGGALVSNGTGMCATTIEYLVSESISPDDTEILVPMMQQLGCRVLAMVPALEHEPTLHVDPFVQFLGPATVAVASFDRGDHPLDWKRMEATAIALRSAASDIGLRLKIVRVPTWLEDKTYYSYINGLRLADAFLVPSFDEVPGNFEAKAHRALANAVPQVPLVTVPGDDLVALEGVVHCAALGLEVGRARPSGTTAAVAASRVAAGVWGAEPDPADELELEDAISEDELVHHVDD